jgi:hypothetical protein
LTPATPALLGPFLHRFLAKGVTLELLLTQLAHHAHDNSPPGFQAGLHGTTASPTDSADSGSDDLGGDGYGADPSAHGGGADRAGASDDEGCSPGTGGGYSFMGPAYGAYCYPLSHPHLQQLRTAAPCSSLGGAASGSAATFTAFNGGSGSGAAFGEEDEGDTFDTLGFIGAGAVRATGAQYDTEEAGADNSIESLLEQFASAGAAAAAVAAGAGAAGAADALGGWQWLALGGSGMATAVAGAAAKRDQLAVALGEAADCGGSPLKRLRLSGGDGCDAFAAALGGSLDEALPICYADQRVGSSSGGSGTVLAGGAAAAVVRKPLPGAGEPSQPEQKQQRRRQGLAIEPAAPGSACDWTAGVALTPCANGGLELLDALPSNIRSCLVDAAALYLANDASGLAA